MAGYIEISTSIFYCTLCYCCLIIFNVYVSCKRTIITWPNTIIRRTIMSTNNQHSPHRCMHSCIVRVPGAVQSNLGLHMTIGRRCSVLCHYVLPGAFLPYRQQPPPSAVTRLYEFLFWQGNVPWRKACSFRIKMSSKASTNYQRLAIQQYQHRPLDCVLTRPNSALVPTWVIWKLKN